MQTRLTENLYAAFPQLYRGRHKPPSESSMCWGFECGDGWYQVLYDLSQELSKYQTAYPTLNLEVVQVKSKFGILRVHLNYRDAITEKLIELAQQRAGATCEQTGSDRQCCEHCQSTRSIGGRNAL